MSTCRICTKEKNTFVMNNKWVCMHCDELLFDLEIECDEYELVPQEKSGGSKAPTPKTTVTITKK